MNLLICHRKGKHELVIVLRVPPQMEFLPLFLTFFVLICPVWPGPAQPGLARPGRPQLHVAAMPPLRVPFVSKKERKKERKRSVLLFFLSVCQNPSFWPENPQHAMRSDHQRRRLVVITSIYLEEDSPGGSEPTLSVLGVHF